MFLCLAILVEHRLVTDRETDGQTDRRTHDHGIYRAERSSRGKNKPAVGSASLRAENISRWEEAMGSYSPVTGGILWMYELRECSPVARDVTGHVDTLAANADKWRAERKVTTHSTRRLHRRGWQRGPRQVT